MRASPHASSFHVFAIPNGDLMVSLPIAAAPFLPRAGGVEFQLTRDEATALRGRLAELLDQPLAPRSETVAAVAAVDDVADTVRALYRPGGPAFAEALDVRLEALERAHADLDAYCGPEAVRADVNSLLKAMGGAEPTWPTAMRTDAAAQERQRHDLDATLRRTRANLGPEMRSVFGSEDGFRQTILTGRFPDEMAVADRVARRVDRVQRGGKWMGA